MKRFFVFFIILVLAVINISAVETSVTIKRKVAIIPIYNSTKLPDNNFLSTGIADSLRAALQATDSFILIDQTTVEQKLRDANFDINRFIWEDTAVQISEILEADVVVFGFFQLLNPRVISINLNALDAQVRKSATTVEIEGPTGVQITTVFDDIAGRMADRMKEVLAPYVKTVKTFSRAAIISFNGTAVSNNDLNAINEALRGAVIQQRKFDVVEPALVQSILTDLGLTGKPAYSPEDLIRISAALNAQMLIMGNVTGGFKYSVNIEVRDGEDGSPIFTKSYRFNKTGEEYNQNILIMADDISNYETLLAERPEVTRPVETTETPSALSPLKIAGIATLSSGVSFMVTGTTFLVADLCYFIPKFDDIYYNKDSTDPYLYEMYTSLMYPHIFVFFTSIGFLSLGLVATVVGIVLLVLKQEDIAFEVGAQDDNFSYGLVFKL